MLAKSKVFRLQMHSFLVIMDRYCEKEFAFKLLLILKSPIQMPSLNWSIPHLGISAFTFLWCFLKNYSFLVLVSITELLDTKDYGILLSIHYNITQFFALMIIELDRQIDRSLIGCLQNNNVGHVPKWALIKAHLSKIMKRKLWVASLILS